jgi:hypothetical protein
MANNFYIKRAEYVEVPVPAGNVNQKIYFPDLPNLRTSKIFGMEVYDSTTHAFSVTGATNQALAEIRDTMVSLYFDGGDFIQIPALSLFRFNGTTFYGQIPMLAGQVIVWAKSYLYLTDTAGIATYAGKSFVFNVYYSKAESYGTR